MITVRSLILLLCFAQAQQVISFSARRPHNIASSRQLQVNSYSGANKICKGLQNKRTRLQQSVNNEDNSEKSKLMSVITSDPSRSISFSSVMVLCGAALGPFLDSYHSAFGVLKYEEPITAILWGNEAYPGLTTAWWVPELFGLAGFLIGWLYILFDALLESPVEAKSPSPPKILVAISIFTLQYWLSGVLYQSGVPRSDILTIMASVATVGYFAFDNTVAGLITSLATAFGGPLIEVGLLSTLHGHGGYQYSDAGETGFFPLWIVPVYFLGGPAVGNLARGFWNLFTTDKGKEEVNSEKKPNVVVECDVCNGTRCVGCPNCDAQGYYITYGQSVKCTSCRGRGFVICRACFSQYDEDPEDIDAIREKMSRMPD
mmetsp:Transcript_10980/g.16979  ORF Transcript_10980/g.16979 Transcript_10980/m.16979 type:complete len:374 (+) Transcript_10980:94-1215(+)